MIMLIQIILVSCKNKRVHERRRETFNLSFNFNFKKSKKREMQIIQKHSNQF